MATIMSVKSFHMNTLLLLSLLTIRSSDFTYLMLDFSVTLFVRYMVAFKLRKDCKSNSQGDK